MGLLVVLAVYLVGPLLCYLLGRWRIGMRIRLALWAVLCWWWLPVMAMVVGWEGLVYYWQIVVVVAVFSTAMNGIPLMIGMALGEQAARDRQRPGNGHPRRAVPPPAS